MLKEPYNITNTYNNFINFHNTIDLLLSIPLTADVLGKLYLGKKIEGKGEEKEISKRYEGLKP
jgi:hypothetical protein